MTNIATTMPESAGRFIEGTRIVYFQDRMLSGGTEPIYTMRLSKEQLDCRFRMGQVVDHNRLREEIEMQSSLFSLLLEDLPAVRALLETQSVALERVRSEVATAIRHQANTATEKLTEAKVKERCLIHFQVSALERAVGDLKGIADQLDHFKKHIMLRDSSLRALVQLNTSEYFVNKETAREEGRV